MTPKTHALTITEALIGVAMLTIAALIVVPEWTSASTNVEEVTLAENLHRLRAAVRDYRQDHNGELPSGECFVSQLTLRTTPSGDICAVGEASAADSHGPYLQKIPRNPFVNSRFADHVEVGRDKPGGSNAGWYFNERTGVVSPDDDAHGGL